MQKYIRPGSIINTDGWSAYGSLQDFGYSHKVVNHSVEFVDKVDPSNHTQTIERLWRDLKEWSKRPGTRPEYFEQYFSRYLFIRQFKTSLLHHLFIEAARLYPPQSNARAVHISGAPIPTEVRLGSVSLA